MALLVRRAPVGRDRRGEVVSHRRRQKPVVRLEVPLAKRYRLDDGAFELFLERAVRARRDCDVEEDLHALASGALGAVRISGGCGEDGAGARVQDGGGGPGVDLEVARKVVQRNVALDPVEELLHGQAGAPKAGGSAHACRIDLDRFLQRHGRIRFGLGRRPHGRGRQRAGTDLRKHMSVLQSVNESNAFRRTEAVSRVDRATEPKCG